MFDTVNVKRTIAVNCIVTPEKEDEEVNNKTVKLNNGSCRI